MQQVSPSKRKHSSLSESPPGKKQDSLSESSVPSTKRRRTDSNEERSDGEQCSPTRRGHTFRVRGVPLDWDVNHLASFLAERYDSARPRVGSLAKEIHGCSHTATVAFQDVPRQTGRSWQISLPASNKLQRSQSLTVDDDFLGITTLHTPPPEHHKVDIIAVSGLSGHAFGSFKEKKGEHMWLRDALPHDIVGEGDKHPLARVMVYGHKSSLPASESFQNLEDVARNLRASLLELATAAIFRPIIFIAHSLGGLIVKETVILLSKSSNEADQKLLRAVYGIVFFGVPHDGMDIGSLIPMVGDGPNRFLLESIGSPNSQVLSTQRREFLEAFGGKGKAEVICFYETRKSPTAIEVEGKWQMTGRLAVLVTTSSATDCRLLKGSYDTCAIDRTHSEMVKFGQEDHEYDKARVLIQGIIRRALAVRSQSQRPNIKDVLEHNPESRDCLSDLFVSDSLDDKKALKRKKGDRAAGTCEWILDTEELTAWLGTGQTGLSENQSTNVLWLHGYPGTGKSTLAIFLTDALLADFSVKGGNTLAYFFCDSAFDTRKTATSVIRGLLFQLVQQHPPLLSYLLPEYSVRKAKVFDSFDALWPIFIAAAADQATGRKYCIIDALDECDQESQKTLLHQLRETFQSRDTPSNVRVLVTSRPYEEIREHLEVFANKDLATFPEAKQDIDLCIKERVTGLARKKKYTAKIKRQVTDILRDKAEGTFLWVGIACSELEDISSKDAIPRLKSMPKGLNELYEKLLDTAFGQETAETGVIQDILRFVAVSLRPLKLLELYEACQLDEEEEDEEDVETRTQFMRDYIASCRLIVVIQDEKVLLLHQSVKDYLIKVDKQARFSELEAHADLAYRCVNKLIEQFHDMRQTRSPLSEYATREWPNHARLAQSRFEVKVPQVEFFEIDSPCREHWLTLYRRIPPSVFTLPQNFSLLHVAAKWGIPAIAEYVSLSYSQHHKVRKLIGLADASDATALQCAAASGYPNVMRVLLDLGGQVTAKVAQAAARSSQNSKEVITLLLDRRGDEVVITEEVVKAAAGNVWNGKQVMRLLLDHRGNEITITEEVVKAAAGNVWNGKQVMRLLLDHRGIEITITEEVMKAAAGNWSNGKEVMALLLDHRGNEITITEEVMKAAAGNESNGKEVMALLLDHRGNEITITEEVMKAAAGNRSNGKEVMALLLDHRGNEITITEEVVTAAAGNWSNGKEVMELLLDHRGGDMMITEGGVDIIAGQFDKKVMTLLLDHRGNEITITEEVVTAAAGNRSNGVEVMELLLDHRGNEITITEEVVTAAAGNGSNGKEVIELLLERRGDEITITEEVVKVAAGNWSNGKQVMRLLLDYRGNEITITEDVMKAAAGNWSNGKEVMAMLLERRGGEITITEEVVKVAAGNCDNGKEVMAMLLERRGDEITITEEVVKAAAGNVWNGKQVMRLLLDHRGNEITITEEVMKAAAGNWSNGKEVMALLLERRGNEITITEEVVKAAAGNCGNGKEVMALLLKRRGAETMVSITEETFTAAATCGQDRVLDLLSRQNGLISVQNEWRCIAKFYNAAKDGDARCIEQLIREGTNPDTKNFKGETPLWAATRYFGGGAVVKVLAPRTDVNVNSVSINGRSPLFWPSSMGNERVVAILMEAGADPNVVDENGDTAITVARKNGHDRIAKMLEHQMDNC